MPTTIRPSSRTAESWGKADQVQDRYSLATSPGNLLRSVTRNDNDQTCSSSRRAGGGLRASRPSIIQSSFSDLDSRSATFATKNGLLHACIEAYNEHHKLIIRPEDVWFAILTQLSAYVNSNAEQLRSTLVDHSGQKELHIEVELEGLDHSAMAFQMTQLLGVSLHDPGLRDWILPAFSTTQKTDQTVASVIFMGTMQKYFTYSWGTRCGIPEVTLLGDAADWNAIWRRCSDRLGSGAFGPAAQRWYRTLRPVLAGFVETFRHPAGQDAQRFWQGVVDEHQPNGSGMPVYSGWITAFAYWDEKGRCLHDAAAMQGAKVALTRGEMPTCFVKTPVTLLDKGKRVPTEMLAGSVALRISKSSAGGSGSPARGGRQRWDGYDTIQSESGWFMYSI